MLNIQLLNCDLVTEEFTEGILDLDFGSVSGRLHSSILPPSDQITLKHHKTTRNK